MRYVATAALLGLAGSGFISAAKADDLGFRPAMLNSNLSALSATTGIGTDTRSAVATAGIPVVVLAPRQAMSSSMPAGIRQ